MLVYVDDTMVCAPTELIESTFKVCKSIWDVKFTGIIVTDGVKTESAVNELKFLGCWLRRYANMYTVDQIPYIEEKLAERGLTGIAGRRSLFDPQEGVMVPVGRSTP